MNKINHLGSVQRRSTKSTISSSSVAKWRKQHRYTSAQTHLLCFGRSTDSRRFFRNRICDIMMGLKETRCTRHPSSGRPPTLRMKGGGEHGHLYQQNREHTHTHTHLLLDLTTPPLVAARLSSEEVVRHRVHWPSSSAWPDERPERHAVEDVPSVALCATRRFLGTKTR